MMETMRGARRSFIEGCEDDNRAHTKSGRGNIGGGRIAGWRLAGREREESG